MDYALAKELSDAGFPMPERYGVLLKNCTCSRIDGAHDAKTKCLLIEPRLSELILECGDSFRSLTKHLLTNEWVAKGIPKELWKSPQKEWSSKQKYGNSNAPDIAVAKLWLALNKATKELQVS